MSSASEIIAGDDPALPRPLRIVSVRRELSDTFSIELVSTDGVPLPAFQPGQFNMLYAFGVGEVAISISSDPGDSTCWVHTIRAAGKVTRHLETMAVDDVLGVRGPFGTPWPVTPARGHDLVIVAGGIGLAPLRPAIYHCLAQRRHYRRISLYYGARTPDDILYSQQLLSWLGRGDLRVAVTVDRAGRDWQGAVGVVTGLINGDGFDPERTVALVCGPEAMMRFACRALNEQGVGEEQIYLSMERNMQCALGYCGHCQLGPAFICKDGPVLRYDRIKPFFLTREL
jgi:NAD(P)H-flavin reductase